MRTVRELKYEEIRIVHEPTAWTSTEYEKADIIGQDRAVAAMEFGLQMKAPGYHIYMSGPVGTGKTTYAQKAVATIAHQEATPKEWCYVYHFQDPSRPQALSFAAGEGKKFKADMEEFIQLLTMALSKTFQGDAYRKEKNEYIKFYQDQSELLLRDIKAKARDFGFHIKIVNEGAYFIPIIDGEKITEAEYEVLSEDQKEEIVQKSDLLQEEAEEVIKHIQMLEKEMNQKLEELDYKTGLQIVGHHITPLQVAYQHQEKIFRYLEFVKEDILENLSQFIDSEGENEEGITAMIPWIGKATKGEWLQRYQVNLLVDHSETKGAPLIIDFNPTFHHLLGKVEYDNEFGNLKTDFTKIRPGLLHEANGGYLILQVKDILSNACAWECIKRVLKTKEISIEPMKEQAGGLMVSTIRPEPIPLSIKIILVGSHVYYHLLYEYDEDFKKLFKIRVDFDHSMPKTKEHVGQMVGFIEEFSAKQKFKQLHVTAMEKIIEHASRLAKNRYKLTTHFNQLVEILQEANTWAQIDESEEIEARHVKRAIQEKANRSSLYEEKMDEMINDQLLMIDTSGFQVGQINGLAVLDSGDYVFAKPSRITATTYMGKAGIINIEKEADLSGNVHTKGVQVLTGYLGQTYAQDFPLSLSCHLCFEQSYYGIDGDSASSTELFAILSSLSEIPIDQGIAVTGSLNQRGEIQAIGGVTHKVEGFFKLCQQRGLTGTQGVLIPEQNIPELVLKEEVLLAIQEGQFHIYPIRHIEEGIQILMKQPAEEVHKKVSEKLRRFYERSIISK